MQNEQVFNTIYQQHYSKVYRLCKGYFNGNEFIANDATQETFIKVWQKLSSFRNEANISTWIFRIAANTCLLHLRKASTQKEIKVDILPEKKLEEHNEEAEEQLKKMYSCIHQLDENNRMIILLTLEGVEYNAIADVIGISEKNLRVKIHRIKKELANCVKK